MSDPLTSIFAGNAPLTEQEVLEMYRAHFESVSETYGPDSDNAAEAEQALQEIQEAQANG